MASVDETEIEEIRTVMFETVMFGMGKHVLEFERKIGRFLGVEAEVIAVNTGTSALHLALEAFDFPRGSEVIVPSITFVASFSAISAAGLIPVPCEVEFPNGHIDCADIEKRLSSKTVAIMPVSYTGTDFDRKTVYELAKKYQLRVIEDNAQAFGSYTFDGQLIGSVGDVSCFSFDGIKNLTCGEGGCIVTNDRELANSIRIRRALGIESDVDLRYKGQRAWEYDVAVQGFRYHMSNINAAIGIAQLQKLETFRKIKLEITDAYFKAIESEAMGEFLVPIQKRSSKSLLHIFTCLLPKGTNRASLRFNLKERGIESGIHYVPNHMHKMYKSSYSLPVAEELGRRVISLPFHCNLCSEDPLKVVKAIKQIISE